MNVSNKRLLLAKDVAHFKFINNKSIDDWAQEDRVLAGVLEKAEDAYIEDAFGQQFFQDQMDANKIIQVIRDQGSRVHSQSDPTCAFFLSRKPTWHSGNRTAILCLPMLRRTSPR